MPMVQLLAPVLLVLALPVPAGAVIPTTASS
jgi:hypothetical protein